jgi:hypothetical protein
MKKLTILSILCLLVYTVEGLNLAPFFTADMNQHTIMENTPVGSVIYTLKGEDPEGSAVKFGLTGTDKLSVDPTTGEVRVEKEIDRESRVDFNDNEIRLMVIIEVCFRPDMHNIRPTGQMWPAKAFSLALKVLICVHLARSLV